MVNKTKCPVCGGKSFKVVFQYTAPPLIETRYSALNYDDYYRETQQCEACQHFIAVQEMDLSAIYEGDYVNATYGDRAGVHEIFKKIINLPAERSDNTGRVKRIMEFASKYWGEIKGKSVLDVGSGLGVFPYLMKKNEWNVTALDPDTRAAEHIREVVNIETICGDFFKVDTNQKFDLVTFNKVLEHVNDPIGLLSKSKDNLAQNGLVYVEVPDGDIAALDGAEREEFTIDHICVFSFISLAITAEKAGFYPVLVERLQEPSTKYTLRAFLKPKN
jgi:2-polyprenyl-3-methyl-5-hydroxy-6-metoxy-1,4-benzoquinol methylase